MNYYYYCFDVRLAPHILFTEMCYCPVYYKHAFLTSGNGDPFGGSFIGARMASFAWFAEVFLLSSLAPSRPGREGTMSAPRQVDSGPLVSLLPLLELRTPRLLRFCFWGAAMTLRCGHHPPAPHSSRIRHFLASRRDAGCGDLKRSGPHRLGQPALGTA